MQKVKTNKQPLEDSKEGLLCGQTKIPVGAKVKITGFTGNDALYNGWEGEATHPFATGCTDKGWIGIRLNKQTVYGYQLNADEKEVQILNADEYGICDTYPFEKYNPDFSQQF